MLSTDPNRCSHQGHLEPLSYVRQDVPSQQGQITRHDRSPHVAPRTGASTGDGPSIKPGNDPGNHQPRHQNPHLSWDKSDRHHRSKENGFVPGSDVQNGENVPRTNDDGVQELVPIPPPTRKYTTTNPGTLSPIYHLFYDLTSPTSPPSTAININSSNIISSTLSNDPPDVSIASTTLNHEPPPLPHRHVSAPAPKCTPTVPLGENLCESNTPIKDGPKSLVPGRDINPGNFGDKTRLGIRGRNGAINDISGHEAVSSLTINGHNDRILTCHFSPPIQAEQRGRENTDDNRYNNNRSGGYISGTSGDKNIGCVDGGKWGLPGERDIPGDADVISVSAVSSNISTSHALQASSLLIRRQNGPKTQVENVVSPPNGHKYKTEVRGDNYSGHPGACFNNRPVNLPEEHVRTRIDSANLASYSNSPGLSVKDCVSLWNNRDNGDKNLNNNKTDCERQTWSNKYSTATENLPRRQEEEIADSQNLTRAVFKCEGDSLRFFIVGDDQGDDDSGVISDNEQQVIPEIPKREPIELESGIKNSIEHSNIVSPSVSSKSKSKPSSKQSNSKTNVLFKVWQRSANKPTKVDNNKASVSKKPVNRWDNIHVLGPQTSGRVSNVGEQTGLTKEASSARARPPATPANQAPFTDQGPFACRNKLWDRDKETANSKGNGSSAALIIQGNSTNKAISSCANIASEQCHKVNCVQFIDDRYVFQPSNSSDCSSQSNPGDLTTRGGRKEVIDRNKYIIKPREVSNNIDHRLNRSHDGVLQPDRDFPSGLDNVVYGDVTWPPPADQLGQWAPSITTDTRGHSVRPSPHSRAVVEAVCSEPVVTTTSNTTFYSDLDHPSRGGRDTLGGGGLSPGFHESPSHSLGKQEQSGYFGGGRQKGEGGAGPLEGLKSPGGEISRCDYRDKRANTGRNLVLSTSVRTFGESDIRENSVPIFGHADVGLYPSSSQSEELYSDLGKKIDSNNFDNKNDFAGDETLSYRKNLREQCKKNQLWNLYSLKSDNSWINNQENQNNQQKPPKITPRQKFEIRHHIISEKVTSNLRHNRNSETGYPDPENASRHDHAPCASKSPFVSNLTLAVHKESPRARFERDRAARASAVTNNHFSSSSIACSREKHNRSCDDLDTSTFGCSKSLADKSPSFQSGPLSQGEDIPDLAPPPLSARGPLENNRLHSSTAGQTLCSNNAEDYSRDSNSLYKSSWINKSFDSWPKRGPRFNKDQQEWTENNVEEAFSRLNTQTNQAIDPALRSVQPSDRSPRDKEAFSAVSQTGFLPVVLSPQQTSHVDTGFSHIISDNISGRPINKDAQTPSVQFVNNSTVQDRNIHSGDSCKNSVWSNKPPVGSHSENYRTSVNDSSQPQILLGKGDKTTNDGSATIQSACADVQGSNPTPTPPETLRAPAARPGVKMSADSVSSSGYESEIASLANKNKHRFQNNRNNEKNDINNNSVTLNNIHDNQSLSNVQQLRLRFGHRDVNYDKTLNDGPEFVNANQINQIFSGEQNVIQNRRLSERNSWTSQEHFDHRHKDVSQNRTGPKDKNKRLDKVNRSMHGIIHDLKQEGCGRSNCKRVTKQKHCSKCERIAQRGSPAKGQGSSRSNSASSESTSYGVSIVNNNDVSNYIIRPNNVSVHSLENNLNNKLFVSSSVDNSAVAIRKQEAEMLAAKGLHIYESGEDYIAMRSPVKSPLHKSLSAPHFRWEGATYLIRPTVVEPFSPKGDTRFNLHVNNNDLMTHRSISDSGASCRRPSPSLGDVGEGQGVSGGTRSDGEEDRDAYLQMGNQENKLTASHRAMAMSVDVLCTEGVSPNPDWEEVQSSLQRRPLRSAGADKKDGGRGYVEWKTCSGWVGNTDMRTVDGRNSRGYVEWDTIWTAAAPWRGATAEDEHVYDVISDSHYMEEGHQLKVVTPVTIDTPPALPERTYINRLKNVDNNVRSNASSDRHHHSNHHSHSNCKKHKHHHHHHHHHNKHLRGRTAASSASSATTTSVSMSSSSSIPSSQQQLTTAAAAAAAADHHHHHHHQQQQHHKQKQQQQ